MLDCLQCCQIDASGGFDHYGTRRDLVILGPPLAVKLRERRQWIERSTVSGVVAGASLAALNVELAIGTLRHHLAADGQSGRTCPGKERCVHSLHLLTCAELF